MQTGVKQGKSEEKARKKRTHPRRRDSLIGEPRCRSENRRSPSPLGHRRNLLCQPPRVDKQLPPYSTQAEPGGAATTHY